MAHTANTWKNGDTITAEKLNAIEIDLAGVGDGAKGDKGAKGDAGPAGAQGASIKAIELVSTDGKITGGTATLTDDSTVAITVTEK